MATLRDTISATDRVLRILTPGAATKGLRFRVDDELIDLAGFDRHIVRAGKREPGVDNTRWIVNRGVGGSTPATHTAGATLTAALSASVSSETLTPPIVFSEGGGGSLSVTDGTTTVDPATTMSYPAGTVTDEGGGEASYSGGTVSLEGEQLVLLSQADMADDQEFVALEAADGVVLSIKTSGGGLWSLVDGTVVRFRRADMATLVDIGYDEFLVAGASNTLLATDRDTDALGFFGTPPIVQPATIAALAMTASDPPTQAEVQAVADAADAILLVLKSLGLVASA